MPIHYNPADWMLATVQQHSEKDLKESGFFESCKSVDNVSVGSSKSNLTLFETGEIERVSLWTQIKMLYAREIRNVLRDKVAIG